MKGPQEVFDLFVALCFACLTVSPRVAADTGNNTPRARWLGQRNWPGALPQSIFLFEVVPQDNRGTESGRQRRETDQTAGVFIESLEATRTPERGDTPRRWRLEWQKGELHQINQTLPATWPVVAVTDGTILTQF